MNRDERIASDIIDGMRRRGELPSLVSIIQERVASAGSQQAAADILGISAQYLCDLLHGRREPSETIADALGFTKRVVYLPKRMKGGK